MKVRTTDEIFNKCITLSKFAVGTGLDNNYKLKNTRKLWKRETWVRVDDVYEMLKLLYQNINSMNISDGMKKHLLGLIKYYDDELDKVV